ncbi:MAG TPA: hypothetical protein VMY34_11805 [Acidimicrobiales bacterium]|nr:hypothetical protein [Acidimicrobiales bacterium]
MHSHATTPAELRAEGIYQVLTPEECVAKGTGGVFTLHPLVGGMPVEEGWRCLRLFGEEVVPHLS